MKDERMKVLEMVEAQKITVEEAAKLLEALRMTEGSNAPDFQEKIQQFSQNVESFAKDVGGKMEGAFKCMEPKIKKATKVVVEKTANLVDEIAKSLNESLKNLEECECCNDCQPCCEEECDGDPCKEDGEN